MQKRYSSCRLKQTLRKRRQPLAWVVQSTEFTVCQGCPSLFLLARWSYRISAQDTKLLRKSESGFPPTCISDIQRNIVGTSPMSRSIIKLLLFVTIHQPLTLPLPAQKATILWRKNYVWKSRDAEQSSGSGSTTTVPQRKDYFRGSCRLPLWTFAPWHFVMLRSPWGPLYTEPMRSLMRRCPLTCSPSHTDKTLLLPHPTH